MTWDFTYALMALPWLLKGLWITILSACLAFILACILGLVIVWAETQAIRPVRITTMAIVHFIRGTPLLVQLFFLFYVLPYTHITLPALGCGIAGFGIHYATYLSQVYRAGINSVPVLQWEAATACNFTKIQTWRYLILPQALIPSLPVMNNYFIAMLKETPLLSSITIMDMMGQANTFGDMHYRYLEPITLVGAIFLLTGLCARWLSGRLSVALKVKGY